MQIEWIGWIDQIMSTKHPAETILQGICSYAEGSTHLLFIYRYKVLRSKILIYKKYIQQWKITKCETGKYIVKLIIII